MKCVKIIFGYLIVITLMILPGIFVASVIAKNISEPKEKETNK